MIIIDMVFLPESSLNKVARPTRLRNNAGNAKSFIIIISKCVVHLYTLRLPSLFLKTSSITILVLYRTYMDTKFIFSCGMDEQMIFIKSLIHFCENVSKKKIPLEYLLICIYVSNCKYIYIYFCTCDIWSSLRQKVTGSSIPITSPNRIKKN